MNNNQQIKSHLTVGLLKMSITLLVMLILVLLYACIDNITNINY